MLATVTKELEMQSLNAEDLDQVAGGFFCLPLLSCFIPKITICRPPSRPTTCTPTTPPPPTTCTTCTPDTATPV